MKSFFLVIVVKRRTPDMALSEPMEIREGMVTLVKACCRQTPETAIRSEPGATIAYIHRISGSPSI